MIFFKAFSHNFFKVNKKPKIFTLRNYNHVVKGLNNMYMLIQVNPSQYFANVTSKCEKDSFRDL